MTRHSNIIISTHYLVYGAAQALQEYLISEKTNKLLYIAHPLNSDSEKKSFYEVYNLGIRKEKKILINNNSNSIFEYLMTVYKNIKIVYMQKSKYDLFVGVNNLNTISGIILRKLGLVDKVIYYTIDFSPKRFNNKLLNYLYHSIDSYCVRHSNQIWNVSNRIADAREKFNRLHNKYYSKQKVVPIGIWYDRVKRKPFKEIKKHQLIFIGNLLEKQGVQHVLNSVPEIVKSIEDFHFIIIGGGEYETYLRGLAEDLNIEKYVTFTGWVKDRGKLDAMMSDSALSIAMYDKYDKNGDISFTYFADPTKLKDYLSAGLPILLTDITHNAHEIEGNKCGKIIKPDHKTISNAVIEIITNDKKLYEFRKNALAYVKQFEWSEIFRNAGL